MEQKNTWNSGTCGTGKWWKKEKQCGFQKKQGAYCTKKRKRNCENVENDEKIWKIR